MDENTQTQPQETAPAAKTKVSLDQLVNLCIEQEASDIHFGEGSRVALRKEGKIVFIENIAPLSKEDSEAMIFSIILTDDEKQRLERVRELDLSYTHSSGVNFRVNVFYQRGMLSASMRMISKHIPTMDELGIPDEMKKLLTLREGLIIVAGSAGSGKSTSIQAMLEDVNKNSVEHIVTIENPIEHVFEDNQSFFTQREVGKDTLTVTNALNSALREDPNIIMVSEINDLETLEHVFTIVETGHLVIASMSTKNARQTLDRMLSMYPHNQKEQAQDRIADNMICVLAQDLVDRVDQAGRVAIYELLLFDPSIQNIVKRGNMNQLHTAVQSGAGEGMISMDTYAYQLAQQGIISQEDASRYTASE